MPNSLIWVLALWAPGSWQTLDNSKKLCLHIYTMIVLACVAGAYRKTRRYKVRKKPEGEGEESWNLLVPSFDPHFPFLLFPLPPPPILFLLGVRLYYVTNTWIRQSEWQLAKRDDHSHAAMVLNRWVLHLIYILLNFCYKITCLLSACPQRERETFKKIISLSSIVYQPDGFLGVWKNALAISGKMSEKVARFFFKSSKSLTL